MLAMGFVDPGAFEISAERAPVGIDLIERGGEIGGIDPDESIDSLIIKRDAIHLRKGGRDVDSCPDRGVKVARADSPPSRWLGEH